MDNDVGMAMSSFLDTCGILMNDINGAHSACPALCAFLKTVKPYAAAGDSLLMATRKVLAALIRGKREILAKHELVGCVEIEERSTAVTRLEQAIERLRTVGDDLDVDTRSLPVTWTMDLDWAIPPSGQATLECMFCHETVYETQIAEHTNDFSGVCNPNVGIAEESGASMGGNQSIICEQSHVQIDPEDKQLFPVRGKLPARKGVRFHSVDSGIDRRPELHELLLLLHSILSKRAVEGDDEAINAKVLVESYDPHLSDLWVQDKQHIYWLHRYVRAGKDLGQLDTPASMIVRACDAFDQRLCIGIPGPELVADAELPRRTVRSAVPDGAGLKLRDYNGFQWLTYADLDVLVRRIAAGLLALTPSQSLVAIVGYNDFEWVLADFSAAVAGMATVGIHTTYSCEAAASVLQIAAPSVLCATLDMLGPVGSRHIAKGDLRINRWEVASLIKDHADSIASVVSIVATDASADAAKEALSHATTAVASFLDMVAAAGPGLTDFDPFQCRGMPFRSASTSCSGSPFKFARNGTEAEALALLLFTSGSSGKPKAVAVGVEAFVHDISGDSSEGRAFSEGVTVSYIPLSHSSDRYKVWQHVIYGGRVALCYFAASNWEAHETEKKDHMLEYSSPIDGLFQQVSSVRPTNMACPPNIWAGLHDKYRTLVSQGMAEKEALQKVASLFGGHTKSLATGGAPTSLETMEFVQKLCRRLNASFVDSYGATEAGAITADGRQIGRKFEDIRMRLVDKPLIGFTHADKPCPRGEVVVSTPSLCLGYFKADAATNDAFLEVDAPSKPCPDWITPPLANGRWYFTGDLASLDATGRLTLIDRVGAVASSRSGRVICLGELETAFEQLSGVRFCLCHVSPDTDRLVAIVVPQKLPEGASGPIAVDGSQLHACTISCELLGLRSDANAKAWEKVLKQIHGLELHVAEAVDDWTVARGLITGTTKKQRGELLRVYASAISRLQGM
jgi:long-subunit acyl-CoA synthetase (AMP-forming)